MSVGEFPLLLRYDYFRARFNMRLEKENDIGFNKFAPGPGIKDVHQVLPDIIYRRMHIAMDSFSKYCADTVGEICDAMLRHEVTLIIGEENEIKYKGDIESERRRFIAKHHRAYFSIDFCAHIYRAVMNFPKGMYPLIGEDLVREVCLLCELNPSVGRDIIYMLAYPVPPYRL